MMLQVVRADGEGLTGVPISVWEVIDVTPRWASRMRLGLHGIASASMALAHNSGRRVRSVTLDIELNRRI